MASRIRLLDCMIWIATTLSTFSPAGAATLLFQAEDAALKNSRLTKEQVVIGLVGDFVELGNGTHDISIDAPRGYALSMTLRVEGQNVQVISSQADPPNCKPAFKVVWPSPQRRDHGTRKDVHIVALSAPRFGAREDVTRCRQPSSLACQKNKVILTTNSEPRGAEIWIDREKLSVTTNSTLSVPYCDYEKKKSVLVRMKGKINCNQEIELSPDRRVSIICQLREP